MEVKAKSEGAEVSVTAKPTTGFTAALWLDYDDAALTQSFPVRSTAYGVSGDRLPYSSRFSGNLSLTQDFLLWRDAIGSVGAAVSYVGNREGIFQSTATRQQYPSYTKTDLHASVKQESWSATVYINNLTDRRGVLNGGLGYFPENAFNYITPRTVGISIEREGFKRRDALGPAVGRL